MTVDEKTARISISDRGCGISPENISSIFVRYRSGNKRKQKGEGSGLGLAIAQGLVRAHGGWIEVQSVPDELTIFTVILPLSRNDERKT